MQNKFFSVSVHLAKVFLSITNHLMEAIFS